MLAARDFASVLCLIFLNEVILLLHMIAQLIVYFYIHKAQDELLDHVQLVLGVGSLAWEDDLASSFSAELKLIKLYEVDPYSPRIIFELVLIDALGELV